nr:CPBP family intramembrane metalloprotease [Eubacteriales bacterium]
MKKNAILEKLALPVTAAVSMAALLLPGYYMQRNWGTLGLVASEVLLLIVAVLSVIVFNGSLKGAFPFGRITLRSVFGSLLTFAGGYILMISATIIVYYFFPEEFLRVQESLSHVIDSDSLLLSLAVIALTPAICEESLFRGALRYFSRWMKNVYLISLIVGILFGIFHMNPIRFVPTAILGMILTFIAVKTDNLLLPMFLHFANNALSVLNSFVSGAEAASEMVTIPKTAVASYITICAAAPL